MKRNHSLLLLLLPLLFVVTHGLRLSALPIFNDEAIYIRWALLIHEDIGNLFVSAQDGKSPLFMWLNALTVDRFDDIVLSGRILSVVAGGLTAGLMFYIGRRIYSPVCGYLSALVYLSLPFFTLHNRMALVDTLGTFFAVALVALLAGATTWNRFSPVRFLGLGLVMGMGFLTKTPFIILFLLLPVSALLAGKIREKSVWLNMMLAGLIALACMAPYLLHEPSQQVAGTGKMLHNADVLKPLIALLKLDSPVLAENMKQFAEYLWVYITPPILFLLLIGVLRAVGRRDRFGIFCLVWWLVPCAAFLVLGREVYSRYFLFSIPPLVFLAMEPLHTFYADLQIRGRKENQTQAIVAGLVLLALIPAWKFDYQWIVAPESTPMAKKDRWQYLESQYSGYGIRSAIKQMNAGRQGRPLWLFVSRTWGMPGDALYLYMKDLPDTHVVEAWWAHTMPIFPDNVQGMNINRSKYQLKVQRTLLWEELKGADVYFAARNEFFPPEIVLQRNPNLVLAGSYHPLDSQPSFNLFKKNDAIKVFMTPRDPKVVAPTVSAP
ncbi:MAG: hypothetical protein COV66_12405 [Nitrospinae bacterium CG11_big_fil_rev_8_21_14_0_20_45_15]|nr:MAG: hypothetical protein COV66_12405 [Nitrospinae bacterium CG11_big_fil_rev_8_21_14_0_20_45_15]